jgi:hypothetical protein
MARISAATVAAGKADTAAGTVVVVAAAQDELAERIPANAEVLGNGKKAVVKN